MKHPFDRGILFPPEVENKRLTAGLPPEEFRPNLMSLPPAMAWPRGTG